MKVELEGARIASQVVKEAAVSSWKGLNFSLNFLSQCFLPPFEPCLNFRIWSCLNILGPCSSNDAVTSQQCPWCCGWDETNSHGLPSPMEEKGQHSHSLKGRAPQPLPWQAFIGLICIGIQGIYIHKAQSLSGSNDQTTDNIQRTMGAYLESGSES